MSDTTTTTTDTTTTTPPATGAQTGQSNPPEPNDTLGAEGVQALEAFKRRAREAEAREKAQASELEKLRDAQRSESEKAVEKARKEAAEGARKEVLGQANRRILTAEIRAAAGGKLADPLDAVRLLDVSSFEVSDDGEVDAKAITKAIDELIAAKPYLAANQKRFEGSADGGARQQDGANVEVSPGLGRLANAYAKSGQKK